MRLDLFEHYMLRPGAEPPADLSPEEASVLANLHENSLLPPWVVAMFCYLDAHSNDDKPDAAWAADLDMQTRVALVRAALRALVRRKLAVTVPGWMLSHYLEDRMAKDEDRPTF